MTTLTSQVSTHTLAGGFLLKHPLRSYQTMDAEEALVCSGRLHWTADCTDIHSQHPIGVIMVDILVFYKIIHTNFKWGVTLSDQGKNAIVHTYISSPFWYSEFQILQCFLQFLLWFLSWSWLWWQLPSNQLDIPYDLGDLLLRGTIPQEWLWGLRPFLVVLLPGSLTMGTNYGLTNKEGPLLVPPSISLDFLGLLLSNLVVERYISDRLTIPLPLNLLLRLLCLRGLCWSTDGPWMSFYLQTSPPWRFSIFWTAFDRPESLGSIPGLSFHWTGCLLSGSLLLIDILSRLSLPLCGNWGVSPLQDHSALCNKCHPPPIGMTPMMCYLLGRRLLSLLYPFWTVDLLSLLSLFLGGLFILPVLSSWPLVPEGQVVHGHTPLLKHLSSWWPGLWIDILIIGCGMKKHYQSRASCTA